MDSLVNNHTIETEELNEWAVKVDKLEDAANIIQEYEEILRTKRGRKAEGNVHWWKYAFSPALEGTF